MPKAKTSDSGRLDDAARAGWLYYVAGLNQDEVAAKLGVSRQSAQRLVSLSISEKLVRFRLDHPIAQCMSLAEKLKKRFNLLDCEIVPNDLNPEISVQGLPEACAAKMEKYLKADDPQIMTLGTGRVLRAGIEQLSSMNCSHHKIVSLVGNIAPDGSASSYDVIIRIADHIKAPHYPMPLPVIAATEKERDVLQLQKPIQKIFNLANQSTVTFMGVGHIGQDAPLVNDGFITQEELNSIQIKDAIGELIGWIYDEKGNLINCEVNDRVASSPIKVNAEYPVYGVASGKQKIDAIFGALQGRLINSLITNEYTAKKLLSKKK